MAGNGTLHCLRHRAQVESDGEEKRHSDSVSDPELVDPDGDDGENSEPRDCGEADC